MTTIPLPDGREYKCVICRYTGPVAAGRPVDDTIPFPSWRCNDIKACGQRALELYGAPAEQSTALSWQQLAEAMDQILMLSPGLELPGCRQLIQIMRGTDPGSASYPARLGAIIELTQLVKQEADRQIGGA